MSEWFQITLAYLPLGTILVGLPLLLLFCFSGTVLFPKPMMFLFVAAVLIFSNTSSFGLKEDDVAGFSIYGKGQRYFLFPVIMLYIWGLWVGVQVRRAFSREPAVPNPLSWWLGGLVAIVLAHALVAPAFDRNVLEALQPSGLIQILNMALVTTLMIALFRTEGDLEQLTRLIIVIVSAKMLYGLVRFALLGGDPTNPYENIERINVRITYFDINESVTACMLGTLCAWRFAAARFKGALSWERMFYLAVIALCLFIIIFSYRRSSWIGLALAVVVVFSSRRWPYRLATAAGAAVLGLPLIIYVATRRLSSGYSSGGWLETFAPDATRGGVVSFREGRFSELYAAVQTVGDNWLWGLGSWGEFFGRFFRELAYHKGFYGFVHSGFVHVYMKAGMIGLTVFSGLFITFTISVLKRRADVSERFRPLYEGALAAYFFSLPNLFAGTPVIEFRTMVLLGFVMAVPIVISGVAARTEVRAA